MLSNMEDMRNIDDSVSDIYSIQEVASSEESPPGLNFTINKSLRADLDETHTCPIMESNRTSSSRKSTNETDNLLKLPSEAKPLNRLYGSTKHLFQKQLCMDVEEETPFLSTPPSVKPQRHDSQESVQRIISERRQRDETLKDFDRNDIYDTAHFSNEEQKKVGC